MDCGGTTPLFLRPRLAPSKAGIYNWHTNRHSDQLRESGDVSPDNGTITLETAVDEPRIARISRILKEIPTEMGSWGITRKVRIANSKSSFPSE
jgi:hypothetical protein